MHAYPNHCVLSETEKYNGALEITKYSNFVSTVIKEEKSTTSPHPFKSHCSMSQRYSIIPYKEYLLSFLHYYYIIHYLYYYRMSSNTGPQLRLTAPLCLPLWRHMAQKHPWTAFITRDMTKSERKARLVGLFNGWGNEGKLKKKSPRNLVNDFTWDCFSLLSASRSLWFSRTPLQCPQLFLEPGLRHGWTAAPLEAPAHTRHAQLARGSHPGDEPRDKEENSPQTSAPPHLQCEVQGQVQHLPLKCAPDESSLSGTVTPLFHRQFYQEDQNKKKSFKSLKQWQWEQTQRNQVYLKIPWKLAGQKKKNRALQPMPSCNTNTQRHRVKQTKMSTALNICTCW